MSEELKNNIKIKVGQAVLELLIQNQHFDFLIYNLKTAWPTKIDQSTFMLIMLINQHQGYPVVHVKHELINQHLGCSCKAYIC